MLESITVVIISGCAALAFTTAGVLIGRHAERRRHHRRDRLIDLIGARPRQVPVSDPRKNVRVNLPGHLPDGAVVRRCTCSVTGGDPLCPVHDEVPA